MLRYCKYYNDKYNSINHHSWRHMPITSLQKMNLCNIDNIMNPNITISPKATEEFSIDNSKEISKSVQKEEFSSENISENISETVDQSTQTDFTCFIETVDEDHDIVVFQEVGEALHSYQNTLKAN